MGLAKQSVGVEERNAALPRGETLRPASVRPKA